jgi:hypothetical protein
MVIPSQGLHHPLHHQSRWRNIEGQPERSVPDPQKSLSGTILAAGGRFPDRLKGGRLHPSERLRWLPESFYEKARDFVFANWKPSLEIDPWRDPKTCLSVDQLAENNPLGGLLHPYKGRHAPGHSIVPNLLMHEVAKREGRDDAPLLVDAGSARPPDLLRRETVSQRAAFRAAEQDLVAFFEHLGAA